MKKKAHLLITVIWGFASLALNGFIFLYLTPRITNTIGIEANGYVSLAKSFSSYADIIMTALNSYAARYMAIAYMKGEKDSYRKYFSTVFYADLIIGGAILLIGIIITINLSFVLKISDSIVADVKLLFLITFLSFFIKTLTTVYLASGHVKDKIDIVNIVRGLSYLAEIVFLLYVFSMPDFKIWQAGFATLLSTIVVFIGMYITTKKMIPESTPKIRLFSTDALKELVFNGIWNSANSLGNALNSGLDLLVSNLMLSELEMGQVSVAKTVSSMVVMLYIIVVQPFQPRFLSAYAKQDIKELMHHFEKSMELCGMMTNVIFAGFFAVGIEFYRLWIPTQDIYLIYYLTIIALLPCISEGCVYPLYYIYTLTVKNRIPCLITIAGGLLNVLSMFLLIRFTGLGVYSIVITTAVIMNIINLVTNPLYMCHCLKIKPKEVYIPILKHVILCLGVVIAFMYITRVLPIANTWGKFVIKAILLGAIGFIIQKVIYLITAKIHNSIKSDT